MERSVFVLCDVLAPRTSENAYLPGTRVKKTGGCSRILPMASCMMRHMSRGSSREKDEGDPTHVVDAGGDDGDVACCR
jgi:hypothetical protein